MRRINKFNIHWQIVRVSVKKNKIVSEKIQNVISFLQSNPNMYNYYRVLNWLQTTSFAYKRKDEFKEAIQNLKKQEKYYLANKTDIENNLIEINTDQLIAVQKDLMKRKYNFQYTSIPKSHVVFMTQLNQELSSRTEVLF